MKNLFCSFVAFLTQALAMADWTEKPVALRVDGQAPNVRERQASSFRTASTEVAAQERVRPKKRRLATSGDASSAPCNFEPYWHASVTSEVHMPGPRAVLGMAKSIDERVRTIAAKSGMTF